MSDYMVITPFLAEYLYEIHHSNLSIISIVLLLLEVYFVFDIQAVVT